MAVRRTVLFIILLGIVVRAWAADAEPSKVEYFLKATYLSKFAAYVEWPPSPVAKPDTRLTIGIIGADEIAAALNTLNDERSTDKGMAIKVLKPNEPLTGVQILFIGRKENAQLKELLAGTKDLPLLTVTEADGALDLGSIINFVAVDERVKFEISVTQAERNGLKISSRLLGVAQKIDFRRP